MEERPVPNVWAAVFSRGGQGQGMRLSGIIRKTVTTIGFAVFLFVGYLSVNVVTSCRAQAQLCYCGGMCLMPGSIGAVLAQVTSAIQMQTRAVVPILTADITVKTTGITQAILAQIDATRRSLIGAIDEVWYKGIEPSMKLMTAQFMQRDTTVTAMLGAFADAQEMNRTRMMLEQQALQSHREQRPAAGICTAATVTGGLASVNILSRAYSTTAPAEQIIRSANKKGTPAARGRETDAAARYDKYVEKYCDPKDNAGAAGCDQKGALAGRDIDVAGEIFMKRTIDITNDDTNEVINDLITNITQPFVRDTVPKGAVKSEDGKQELLAGDAYDAKRQVIYDALYYVVGRRVPGAQKDGASNFVGQISQAANIDPSLISDNPSRHEILTVMMNDRFRTGDYGTRQIDEVENNERELIVQEAFEAMQMNDLLDLLDRYSLIMAAQAGPEIGEAKPFNDKLKDLPK